MKQWLTLEEKKDLVQKVRGFSKSENISIKEACKRLDIPFWRYYAALKTIKKVNKNARAEARALAAASDNGALSVELVFKGDAAKLVREYADKYSVEPEVVCKILLIDTLKEKKQPIPR